MGYVNEENVKTDRQETKEFWKKAKKSDHHPGNETPKPRPRRPEDSEAACRKLLRQRAVSAPCSRNLGKPGRTVCLAGSS